MDFFDENSKIINIIAAMSENRVIGKDNKIPWHSSTDLKRFKALTLDSTVIMGRKTYESLPIKPLPDRENIVVSKSLIDSRVITVPSLSQAIHKASKEHVFLIGGEQIYREGLNYADYIYLSIIFGEHNGDAFFPELPPGEWATASEMFKFEDHVFFVLKKNYYEESRTIQ